MVNISPRFRSTSLKSSVCFSDEGAWRGAPALLVHPRKKVGQSAWDFPCSVPAGSSSGHGICWWPQERMRGRRWEGELCLRHVPPPAAGGRCYIETGLECAQSVWGGNVLHGKALSCSRPCLGQVVLWDKTQKGPCGWFHNVPIMGRTLVSNGLWMDSLGLSHGSGSHWGEWATHRCWPSALDWFSYFNKQPLKPSIFQAEATKNKTFTVHALVILQVAVTQNRTILHPCPSLAFALEDDSHEEQKRLFLLIFTPLCYCDLFVYFFMSISVDNALKWVWMFLQKYDLHLTFGANELIFCVCVFAATCYSCVSLSWNNKRLHGSIFCS